MGRWLGWLAIALGVVLIVTGILGFETLLAAPMESQHLFLPRTLGAGVGGVWLLVLGGYVLAR